MDWYKRYPQPFLSGTATFTLEQRGAYQVLLDYQWDMGGRLPTDERDLAQLLGVSVRKFRSLWSRKLCAKFDQDDSGYFNTRLERERLAALALAEKRREAGKQGGKAKANAGRLLKQTTKQNDDTRGSRENARLTSSSLSSLHSEGGGRERGALEAAFKVLRLRPTDDHLAWFAVVAAEERYAGLDLAGELRSWAEYHSDAPKKIKSIKGSIRTWLSIAIKSRERDKDARKAPDEGIIANVSPGGQGSPRSRCTEKGCAWIGTMAEYGPHMQTEHPELVSREVAS